VAKLLRKEATAAGHPWLRGALSKLKKKCCRLKCWKNEDFFLLIFQHFIKMLKLKHFWRNNQKKSNFSNILGDNLFFLLLTFIWGQIHLLQGAPHNLAPPLDLT